MSDLPALAPVGAEALLRLPFDQYGRYRMISEAIEATRPLLGSRLQILDVGGFFRTRRGVAMLPAQAFFPEDALTVLDQVDCDLPGYQQGDGRGLPFADRAFDLVISCDTLEHVPAADRPAFWAELLRVARHGVALAAPFASPAVEAAEDLLRSFIQASLGVEQPQLAEHVAYGLPDLQATCQLLNERNLAHLVYPSGYVHAWVVMMIAKHHPLFADLELHEQLDRYYTRFLAADERCEPAYRHLLLVKTPAAPDWLALADAALAPTIRTQRSLEAPGWAAVSGWLPALLALESDRQHSQAVGELRQALSWREAQLRDLQARADWLEGQARDARDALARVERGRVLRLMRWLDRQRKK